MKYYLKGHWGSHKVAFVFKNPLYLKNIFVKIFISSKLNWNANLDNFCPFLKIILLFQTINKAIKKSIIQIFFVFTWKHKFKWLLCKVNQVVNADLKISDVQSTNINNRYICFEKNNNKCTHKD